MPRQTTTLSLLIGIVVVLLAVGYYTSFRLIVPRVEWDRLPDGRMYLYGCDSTFVRRLFYPCALIEVTFVHPEQGTPFFQSRQIIMQMQKETTQRSE